jgi:hypothetical protein
VTQEDYIERSRLISKEAQRQHKADKARGTVNFLLPGTAQAAKAEEEVDRQNKKKESVSTQKELQAMKQQLNNLAAKNKKMQAELDRRKAQQQKANESKDSGGPAAAGAQTNQRGSDKKGARKRKQSPLPTKGDQEQPAKSKRRRFRKQQQQRGDRGSNAPAGDANPDSTGANTQGQNPNSTSLFVKSGNTLQRKKNKQRR